MKRKILFILLACILMAWPTGCAFAPAAASPTATATAPAATPTPAPTLTPAPLIQEGTITFTLDDGRKFFGTVYGHGETAIILANMSYGSDDQWGPFVEAFDKAKFTVITFNYVRRSTDDYSSAENEVKTILDTLKGLGYKRAICMGASLGVSACGFISHAPEMVGMVMIAGPNYGGTSDTAYPKLFIAGKLDQWSAPTESEYNRADEPKTLVIYPDIAAHGTDLFGSMVKDQFLKDLLDFVNKIVTSQ